MSFGFSPSDVFLLGNFLLKVRGALRDDGSRVQYLRAMKQCSDFDVVLDSIRRLDVSDTPEAFKEQLAECAFDARGVINDFRRTVARYEKSMGEGSSRGKIASAPRKIQWAFDAADDLDDFRKRLQSQVNRIQIILQINTWEMMTRVERRTQFLDGPFPTSVVLAPTRRNAQMAGAPMPLIMEPVYREIQFIGELLFERFFRSKSPLPISDARRAFTLPYDGSDALVAAAQPQAMPISAHQALGSVPGTRQRNAHTSSSTGQAGVPAQSPNQSAGTSLRDEINELLQSLNLERLSEKEEQQLQVYSSASQLFLESPSTTESLAGSTQSTTFRNGASAATLETEFSPGEKQRKSRRFAIPKFSGFGVDPISVLGLAASLVQLVDYAAKLATSYRTISDQNRELRQLASTISRASDILNMLIEISSASMSGQIQGLALNLCRESQIAISGAEDLLRRLTPSSFTLRNRLSMKIKFQIIRQEVKDLSRTLERLDGQFLFILQIHQAKTVEPLIGQMNRLDIRFEVGMESLQEGIESLQLRLDRHSAEEIQDKEH